MAQTTKKRRWYLLGAILATLHTALFLLVFLLVVLSEDTEAGMLFYIFVLIDFPIGIGLLSSENPLPLLIFGGMLWFFYGFIIQSLIRLAYIRRTNKMNSTRLSILLIWSVFAFTGCTMSVLLNF